MTMTDKNLIKICLTGGPCAGKTTALSKIVETFTPKFAVYAVPELATITFSSGVTIIPSSFTEEDSRKFTSSIIQAQIDIEKYFENLALTQRKKAILIMDRGCCDNFAYTSTQNKKMIMNEQNWTTNFLSSERYDMVIHLVTAASGAEEFYTLDNNAARSESAEQAIEVDRKIQAEWMGNPNFVLIDNKIKGFAKKIDRVIDLVSGLTGEKTSHKIIKKYLVDPSFTIEQIPKTVKYEQFYETQTFLLTNKLKTQNYIFKRTYNDEVFPIYVFVSRTIEEKYEKRIEKHRNITEKMYMESLSSQKDPKYDQTKKSIVFFTSEIEGAFNMYYIEKTTSNGETSLILKVIRDTVHENSNIIPNWIKVQEEITERPRYFSMNFARRDYHEKMNEKAISLEVIPEQNELK